MSMETPSERSTRRKCRIRSGKLEGVSSRLVLGRVLQGRRDGLGVCGDEGGGWVRGRGVGNLCIGVSAGWVRGEESIGILEFLESDGFPVQQCFWFQKEKEMILITICTAKLIVPNRDKTETKKFPPKNHTP